MACERRYNSKTTKNEVFQLPSRIRCSEEWAQRVRASSQTVSNLILLKANELANAGMLAVHTIYLIVCCFRTRTLLFSACSLGFYCTVSICKRNQFCWTTEYFQSFFIIIIIIIRCVSKYFRFGYC